MKKTNLYIAMSLDGYIADIKGGVDWLAGDGSQPDHPGTYGEFFKGIDTLILGHRTYRQIVEELSPGDWVYKGAKTYVLTRDEAKLSDSSQDIIFTNEDPQDLINRLRAQPGKKIWLAGGSRLVNSFIDLDEVDIFTIALIPILLGRGIGLFETRDRPIALELVKTKTYNGIVELEYKKR